ncbi:ATP-binding cassette domain-containing protein, partial [Candidatus Woesearchaeota archaeon]|nr:ATP-binding cassette domain-containing protein [Candidatus Woesearchaeota archaeon]
MTSINVKNISKKYKIRQHKPGFAFLRDTEEKDFFSLKKVSLNVKKGECVGIIGPNGSGKSTLLRIIGGVTKPTFGNINIKGDILSFLDLNAGFQEELTGRENIFLFSSFLGFSRKEVAKKYDEIVLFAELKEFMDVKLKNYSDGMKIRLAFSTAVAYFPDILLLDEILSVGDELFQKKSLNKIKSFKSLEKSIIIVSHNLNHLRFVCDRIIYLKNGKIIMDDLPDIVIQKYLNDTMQSRTFDIEIINDKLNKLKVLKKRSIGIETEKTQFFINLFKKNKTKEDIKKDLIITKEEIINYININSNIIDKNIEITEKEIVEKFSKEKKKILIDLIDKRILLYKLQIELTNLKGEKITFLQEIGQLTNKQFSFGNLSRKKQIEKKFEGALEKYRLSKNTYTIHTVIEDIVFFSSEIDVAEIIKKNELLFSLISVLDDEIKYIEKIENINIVDLDKSINNLIVGYIILIFDKKKLLIDLESLSEQILKFSKKNEKNRLNIIKFLLKRSRLMMSFKKHNPFLSGILYSFIITNIIILKKSIKNSFIKELDEHISSWIFDSETKISQLKRELLINLEEGDKNISQCIEEKIQELSLLLAEILKLRNELKQTKKKQERIIKNVFFSDEKGNLKNEFQTNDFFQINLEYIFKRKIMNPVFGISIFSEEGFQLTGINTKHEKLSINNNKIGLLKLMIN